jgi:hypothetical protein
MCYWWHRSVSSAIIPFGVITLICKLLYCSHSLKNYNVQSWTIMMEVLVQDWPVSMTSLIPLHCRCWFCRRYHPVVNCLLNSLYPSRWQSGLGSVDGSWGDNSSLSWSNEVSLNQAWTPPWVRMVVSISSIFISGHLFCRDMIKCLRHATFIIMWVHLRTWPLSSSSALLEYGHCGLNFGS